MSLLYGSLGHLQKLWNRKRVHSFFTANSILKFRFEERDRVNIIVYQQDLKDLFPDVDIDELMNIVNIE